MTAFPPAAPSNEPELPALSYRIATYDDLFDWLELLLASPSIPGTGAGASPPFADPISNPLHHLPLRTHSGFLQGLFDAWAVVGDVLTFYQERILNEGFLRTAVEQYSGRMLMSEIGYMPLPPLSAQTMFAFTVRASSAAPGAVTIRKGTQINAMPAGSAAPPVFETDADLIAHPDWNALDANVRPSDPAQLEPGATEARLIGDTSVLRAGAPLLVAPPAPEGGGAAPPPRVVTIQSVDVDKTTGVATVRWEGSALDASAVPDFIAFRSTTGLFGARAPNWSGLPPATKAQFALPPGGVFATSGDPQAWLAYAAGAKNEDVVAVAYAGDGTLYAMTSQRIQVWNGDPSSGSWSTVFSDQRGGLLSLAIAGDAMYLGTARGDVRVSRDGGRNWSDVGSPLPTVLVTAGTPSPTPPPATTPLTRLPAVAVRSLAIWSGAAPAPIVLAGTDRGLAATTDDGSPWQFYNDGLAPGAAGLAGVSLASLASFPLTPAGSPAASTTTSSIGLLAATSNGVAVAAITYKPVSAQSEPAPPLAVNWDIGNVGDTMPVKAPFFAAACSDGSPALLYAGGEAGLWQASIPRMSGPPHPKWAAWTWTQIENSALAPSIAALAASGAAVVASSKGGAAISADAGLSWTVPPVFATDLNPATAMAVRAAAGAPLAVAVALPLGAFAAEWDGFAVFGTDAQGQLTPNDVDLDRMFPSLTDGGRVLLADASGPAPAYLAATVSSVKTVRSRAFMQTGLVSEVAWPSAELLNGATPSSFGRRTTRAYFDSRVLQLEPDSSLQLTAVEGSAVVVDGVPEPFGLPRDIAVSGKAMRLRIVGLAGGIRALPAGATLPPGAPGLDGMDCVAIATPGDGVFFFVATGQGVYRCTLGAEPSVVPWGLDHLAPDNGDPAIRTLALAGANIVAATADGIWWSALPQSGAAAAPAWTAGVLPGTLARAPTRGLAFDGTILWTAVDGGILQSADFGANWALLTEPGVPPDATVLVVAGTVLLAGTSRGVAVRTRTGWSLRANGLRDRDVQSLACNGNVWFCGTRTGGLFRCDDAASFAPWVEVPLSDIGGEQRVPALLVQAGKLYCALRGSGVFVIDAAPRPPNAPADPCFVDLGISNDVRALAALNAPDTPPAVYAAARSGTVVRTGTIANAPITLHELGTVTAAAAADLDAKNVMSALRLALKSLGVAVPAQPVVEVVEPGSCWLIVLDGVNDLLLRYAPGGAAIAVAQIDSFVLASAPMPGGGTPPQPSTWTIQFADGSGGSFNGLPADVRRAPAADDDPVTSENVQVTAMTPQLVNGTTEFVLAAPMLGIYDASTVTVLANAVAGSHGQTSASWEVIGSGDATQADQEFTLLQKPITMLPTGPGGRQRPQIDVLVRTSRPLTPVQSAMSLSRPEASSDATVAWTYVDDLFAHGPNDMVFTVDVDQSGGATVRFGNGAYGRRLPTGSQNVLARYRVGSGSSGNVPAANLHQLRTKSLAVTGVTNTMPSEGGADASDPAFDEQSCGNGLRSVQRIISLADVVDFALAYGGIAKAGLATAAARKRGYLTLAGTDEQPVRSDDLLADEIVTAIGLSGGAALRIVACPFRRRFVDVEAELHVDRPADSYLDAALAAAAAAALTTAFAFECRDFGQSMLAAEVVASLQALDGVSAVVLTTFCRSTSSPQVVAEIEAADAWSNGADGQILLALSPDSMVFDVVPRS